MRSPTVGELVLLARVLMIHAPSRQGRLARRLLMQAEQARRHTDTTGHAHPEWGDGSLSARCRLEWPPPEPLADDPAFLASLVVAARVLSDRLPGPAQAPQLCMSQPPAGVLCQAEAEEGL